MTSHLESLSAAAGDTTISSVHALTNAEEAPAASAAAGLTAARPSTLGTSRSKKRRRRMSNCCATTSSSGTESDSEFSVQSLSSTRSFGDEKSAPAKKRRAARASSWDDTPGATASAAAAAAVAIDSNHPTKARRGQQQWTELTAVCHILADEVYKYMNPIMREADTDTDQQQQANSSSQRRKQPPHLSMGEKTFLNKLMDTVKNRVDRQSGVVLENRKLVKAAKAAKCKVRDLRNDIMITRLLTGKLEAEVSSLEKQARRRKGDIAKAEQASEFLSAIETLAQRTSK
jgi:hypothetical protein